ncbi:hypothetical protein P692DRAFT_20832442 [Suillus brevipes Sb2]|nr:hypothetical protein P692DRAFT_20832442 [Suillus brevipes Sb2]
MSEAPIVLKAVTWPNGLYRAKTDKKLQGVNIDVPLVNANRFCIRQPGVQWDVHPSR